MKALYLLSLFLLIHQSYCMTEKQVKSTANMVRQVCQPKTKTTNAQIENMHKGEFEDSPNPKCYMRCVFETIKIMKNGKYDNTSAMKQIGTLPDRYIEPTKATAAKCQDVASNSDPCEAAYELAKCWYFSDPEYYFFP